MATWTVSPNAVLPFTVKMPKGPHSVISDPMAEGVRLSQTFGSNVMQYTAKNESEDELFRAAQAPIWTPGPGPQGTQIIDNFNRPDNARMESPPWMTPKLDGTFTKYFVSSNQAVPFNNGVSSWGVMYYNIPFKVPCEAFFTVPSGLPGWIYLSLYTTPERENSIVGDGGVELELQSGSPAVFNIYELDGLSAHYNVGTTTATVSAGSKIGLSYDGTVCRAWHCPPGGAWTVVNSFTPPTGPYDNLYLRVLGPVTLDDVGGGTVQPLWTPNGYGPAFSSSTNFRAEVLKDSPTIYTKHNETTGKGARNEMAPTTPLVMQKDIVAVAGGLSGTQKDLALQLDGAQAANTGITPVAGQSFTFEYVGTWSGAVVPSSLWGANGANYFALQRSASTGVQLYMGGAARGSSWLVPSDLTTVPHHIVLTIVPNSAAHLWLDGTDLGAVSLTSVDWGASPGAVFLANFGGAQFVTGACDEQAIYVGQALSGTRIQAHNAAR